jgi:hypothetical protein
MLKKILGMLLLFSFSVVITLAVAEVGLRIAHIGYPALGGKLHFYTWNPYAGVSLRPDAKGMVYSENTVYSSINHDGFRDREHTKEKPANTFRIAVLGDSFAEAAQVSTDKAFWTVMQHDLGSCSGLGGKNVEVMNFGVSGYGTAQELQMLRHYVWDYSPDLVMLAFFTGNDVQNNNRILQDDPYRPYFVHQDGKLVLDDAFLHAPGWKSQFNSRHLFLSWAIAHSRVLQVAAAAKNYFGSKNVAGVKPTEMGLDDSIYHPPTDPVWQDAWSVTDDLIGVMNEEVKAHNAQLLVATLSSSIQVDPDPTDREKLEKRLGIPNLFYPDDRVRKVAEADGAAALTIAPAFLEYAQEHHAQLHGFRGSRQGHWNELGHQLGGQMMATKVCGMVSQPNPSVTQVRAGNRKVLGGSSL